MKDNNAPLMDRGCNRDSFLALPKTTYAYYQGTELHRWNEERENRQEMSGCATSNEKLGTGRAAAEGFQCSYVFHQPICSASSAHRHWDPNDNQERHAWHLPPAGGAQSSGRILGRRLSDLKMT